MTIESVSGDDYDYYAESPEDEGRAKRLHVSSEESITNAFQRLGALPMMSRCTKIDFEVTVSVQDKDGNRAEASARVSGERDRSSESKESGSSDASNSSNSSNDSNQSK
jgi:hypothetical protein